jgi:hypothetical protein
MRLFTVPIRTFLLYKSHVEISLKGDGCDTPSVTVVATMFYSTPTMLSTMYVGLSSNLNSNPFFEYH